MTATREKYGGNYLPNNSVTRSKRSVVLSKRLYREVRENLHLQIYHVVLQNQFVSHSSAEEGGSKKP
jgi:hypothetical protein